MADRFDWFGRMAQNNRIFASSLARSLANCSSRFSIFIAFFGVFSRNGWEEQSKTIPMPAKAVATNRGVKQRGTIPFLKANRPGRESGAKGNNLGIGNDSLIDATIIEYVFYFVKPLRMQDLDASPDKFERLPERAWKKNHRRKCRRPKDGMQRKVPDNRGGIHSMIKAHAETVLDLSMFPHRHNGVFTAVF